MKLDTTKVYYLGDLSDEQFSVIKESLPIKFKDVSLSTILSTNGMLSYSEKTWWHNDRYNKSPVVNALNLFKNERIAQIQLRIQELNNELIELDEEMRKLTYEL